MTLRPLVPALVLVCLLAPPSFADARSAARLTGRATDATGAPLPGVTVAARGPETRSAVTDADGAYTIGVPPGEYEVTFVLIGFASHVRRAVEVAAGAVIRLDVQMQIALRTEVTVTGRATFRNLAELEQPSADLVGLARSASEGVTTARQIETRPIQRAGEIVETIPGMVATQHTGEGKANQYFLRGFNLDHGTDFATVVAGVPINQPTHAHGQGYTDLNFLIPELVTGVHYFKGPYNAEAGDFASAGGMHISYASALDRPIASMSGGMHGWSRLLVAASPEVANGRLLMAAETAHSDGPWDRPDDYRRWNGIVRYTRGTTLDNLSLTAFAYRARWNGTDQAPRRAVSSGRLARFGGVDATTGGDTSRFGVTGEWQGGGSTVRNRVVGYALRSTLDLFSNFTYFLEDPLRGDQFQQADGRLTAGLRASRAALGTWFGRAVEHRAGVQARVDDIGTLGLYRTQARRRLRTVREDSVHQASAALWMDAEVRWTRWLRSTAGVRADAIRSRVDADLAANSGVRLAALVSPKGTLVLGPWTGTELYLNAGLGFHSNDARGVTMRVAPQDNSTAEPVTPLVRTRGAELGVRSVGLRGVQSTLALWWLSLDSELVYVGDAGTTTANRGSARYGVEWTGFVRLGDHITGDAALSWSRARYAAGGQVPGSVGRVASLGVSAELPGRITADLRWRYVGPRPLLEDGSVRAAAGSVVNADLEYRVTRRWALRAEMFNITGRRDQDAEYFYVSRLPGEPADGFADLHSHPALPRSIRFTAKLRF